MKYVFFTICVIYFSFPMAAQDISGEWNGILKVPGIQLRLVFHISKSVNGLQATMDSPDQGAAGIPVSTTSFADSTLKLAIPPAMIEYEGKLNKDNKFIGHFKQAGQSFPLMLSREKVEKEKTSRPQDPIKPYPYYSEDISFANTVSGITLAGTLTMPAKEGLFPAVILISGSGPQNRDEEILGHKPFLVLADHLTRQGIAVLRYDDRGTGASTGDFKSATTADLATDVAAALDYLQSRKSINSAKIGLVGHSEGGVIAPMLASQSSKIAFIVLMAGTGIPGDQLLLLQQQLIGKASGVSEAELQRSAAINKRAFEIVRATTNPATLKTGLANYLQQTLEDQKEQLIPAGVSKQDFIQSLVDELTSPWMQYFIRYDPAVALQKVKCPVLAINGEKDLQVPSKINLAAIEKALKKGGNKNVYSREFPGLNHLFQESKTGSPAEYATIEQTFSPVAFKAISEWILFQTK